jgi:hypothetical protein
MRHDRVETGLPQSGRAARITMGRDRENIDGYGVSARGPLYAPKESQRFPATAVQRIATRAKMIATVPRFVGPGQDRAIEPQLDPSHSRRQP